MAGSNVQSVHRRPPTRLAVLIAGCLAVAALALVYGCGGGDSSTPDGGSPEAGFRVEDAVNDCFTRPRTGEPQKVSCGDGVDIASVEFSRESIVLRGARPIVAGQRALEFTAVFIMDQGRLTVTATSVADGEWTVQCAFGNVAATPLPGSCSAGVEGGELLVDLSPFELAGDVSVPLLDVSYFRTASEPGVGDFLDSSLKFTLE